MGLDRSPPGAGRVRALRQRLVWPARPAHTTAADREVRPRRLPLGEGGVVYPPGGDCVAAASIATAPGAGERVGGGGVAVQEARRRAAARWPRKAARPRADERAQATQHGGGALPQRGVGDGEGVGALPRVGAEVVQLRERAVAKRLGGGDDPAKSDPRHERLPPDFAPRYPGRPRAPLRPARPLQARVGRVDHGLPRACRRRFLDGSSTVPLEGS
mmetsp:Transcript_36277/g.121511  ORF Transcript_36277/g.121511 Transcript_36277/m.121511 type:complete len:216 (+) Transcript_36277:51-698(+)